MTSPKRLVWRVVIPYAALAAVWFLVSDLTVAGLTGSADDLAFRSRLNDWIFVGFTSVLLAVLLYRESKRRAATDEKLAGAQGLAAAEEAARHTTEAALERCEARYRYALEKSSTGTWELDLVDHTVFNTPEYDRIFGYAEPLPAWTYEMLLDHVEPEDRAEVDQKFQSVIKDGIDREFEFRIRRADGLVRWIWATGGHQADGRRLIAIVQDVTDRKRIDFQLRDLVSVAHQLSACRNRQEVIGVSQAAVRRILHADGASFVAREVGHCVFVATDGISTHPEGSRVPSTETICGWSMDQRVTAVVQDVENDDRIPVDRYRATGVRGMAAVPIRVNDPVGAIGIYWAQPYVASDVDLKLIEVLADAVSIALENVSTYAQLEQLVDERTAELKIALETARDADRAKSAFLATMSHELRTPLNSIIGFTGVMLLDLAGPLNSEQRKQMGMVQGSARHLLALINDVLDLSKVEAGEMTLHPEPFDLCPLLERAVASMRPLADAKGLDLRHTLNSAHLMVESDSRRIEQIILNLLNNAIKFTDTGHVEISTHREPGRVEIRVRDTGIGVAEQNHESIFRPFKQVDSGLSRRHSGTGLGLAISRRLARMAGGDLTIDSRAGSGSTFLLHLPITAQPAS